MRIVVKVGTSTLAHPTGRLNIRRVEGLVKVLSDLKNAGNQLVLVSSGAIGMGVGKLNLPGRPADMPTKQAAAAVGQCELMYTYDKLFAQYNHTVAQLLLTAEDVNYPTRRQNFVNAVSRLLELNALPVVNENDAVATDEVGVATTIGETPELRALAGTPGSALGTGGMATKLKAAEIAMACGCDMVIANGQRPELLYDIVTAGAHTGTRFIGRREGK
ncbi:MAG: glutamate 5-kinase [Oscillospiraceae bacterium]|nr:glutamate 5-kinase [Oscillospiraceae bacterium]